MALKGELVKQISIKSDGDAFFHTFVDNPNTIIDMSPSNISTINPTSGKWGSVGSEAIWYLNIDDSGRLSKLVTEAVDAEKKLIGYRVTHGIEMDLYKSFKWTIRVEKKGENTLVTWTFTYEKKDESELDRDEIELDEREEEPNNTMEFWLNVTKDIDTFLLNPTSIEDE